MRSVCRWGAGWAASALVVAILASSLACGPANDARRVTEAFYQAYGHDRMEGIWGLYAPEFFEQHSKPAWSRQLRRLRENVGAYRSHRLVSQRTATTEKKGAAFTVLTYEVRYAKLQTTETFTIGASATSRGQKILAHDVRYVPR